MDNKSKNLTDILERNRKFKNCLENDSQEFLERYSWKRQSNKYKLDVGENCTGQNLLPALTSMFEHEDYHEGNRFEFAFGGNDSFIVIAGGGSGRSFADSLEGIKVGTPDSALESPGWFPATKQPNIYELDVQVNITGRKLLLALVSMVRHEDYKKDNLFCFLCDGKLLFTVKANPRYKKKGNGIIVGFESYSTYKNLGFSRKSFEKFVKENAKPIDGDKLARWELHVSLVFEIARLMAQEVDLADQLERTSLTEDTDEQRNEDSFDDVPVAFVIYSWVVLNSAECDFRVFQNCQIGNKSNYTPDEDLKGRMKALNDIMDRCGEDIKYVIRGFEDFFLERKHEV